MNDKCLKICLMTFNILCLFAGIVTFAGGLLLQFNPDVQNALKTITETASDTNIGILSVIMSAVGGLIILVSFVGCCGVMSESKCMIGLYCILLLLLLIGQLAIGGLGLYYGKEEISHQIDIQFQKMIDTRDQSTKDILDSVQQFFECCGYNGPDDYAVWKTQSPDLATTPLETDSNATTVPAEPSTTPRSATNASTTTGTTVSSAAYNVTTGSNATSKYYVGRWPESCCKENTSICTNDDDDATTKVQLMPHLYEQGCEEKISAFVEKYAMIIGGVALAFALIEILAIIAGCMLYKSLD